MPEPEVERYWCAKMNELVARPADEPYTCCGKPEQHTPCIPVWMESYRNLFCNTGGNVIEDLLHDLQYNERLMATNTPRFALAVATQSQFLLLIRMHSQGLI